MKLQEAISNYRKTGKPFRRKSWTHADHLIVIGNPQAYGGGELRYWSTDYPWNALYVDDFIAEDWIVYEPTK